MLLTKTYDFISSRLFFRLIVAVSLISAVWIALSARYPMAFDEDFHLGLIRLYASHGLPFWSGQPANADAFGAVARDPSFLYHYLMSFPYHVISFFTDNQAVQVLALRAINIGFFLASLPLFRRLLLLAGASPAVAHSIIAIFVLIPINSLLAAQINYDNLLLPVTALLLIKAILIRTAKPGHRVPLLLQIIALGLFGSLIKFAFLPIFLGVVLWVGWTLRGDIKKWKLYVGGAKTYSRTLRGGLLVGALLFLTVFSFERYVVNVVRYQDPVPSCGKVISIESCKAYGPFERDYFLALNKTNDNTGPQAFMIPWFHGMWLRTFFAVDGPSTRFQTRGPLYAPALSAIVLMIVGAGALVLRGKEVWRKYPAATGLFATVSIVYVAAVWMQQYQLFVATGVPVALNGRYLLPVIIPIMFLAVAAVSSLFGKRRELKVLLFTLALFAALWGGGALTYILRSNDAWYWDNGLVRTVNHSIQNTVGPLTPGYDTPSAFLTY